jgi:hypothetical protein
MNELESLSELRISHLGQICNFADKIKRIDERIAILKTDNNRHDSYGSD